MNLHPLPTKAEQLRARFGLEGHPEDIFWARQSDMLGIGRLGRVEGAEPEGGARLEVEVLAGGLRLYLDTTNPACRGDLWNLSRIPDGSLIAFSGSVRSFDGRGVRLGRLDVQPCAVGEERALFTPKVRFGGKIELGEGCIVDPAPAVRTFALRPSDEGVVLSTLDEVRAHAS